MSLGGSMLQSLLHVLGGTVENPVNLEALVHGDRSGGGGGARVTAGVHFS